jgi:DNA topoisomerase-1
VAEGEKAIEPRAVSTLEHPKWNGYVVRVGRYGPYVEGEAGGEKKTSSLPDDLAPADATAETFRELIETGNAEDRVLGIHPEADLPILAKQGPYGPYVQLGDDEQQRPKRMSLPKGLRSEEVDLQTALALLSLPRTLGDHPDTAEPIRASIGRFGPYVQQGSTFASLKAEDDVLTVELDRALELLAQKSRRNEPLRVIGAHPETGKPVEIHRGRYGTYVKHEKTNATLAKEQDPDALTMEQAVALLADRETKGGGKKRPAGRTSGKRVGGGKRAGRKRTKPV